MTQHANCPACKILLRFRRGFEDARGICPACEHLVLPSDRAETAAETDDAQTMQSIDSVLSDLQREGRSLTREHSLFLSDLVSLNFASKQELDNQLADLKRELPETPSAYVPSGKMPASALGAMLLGTLVGVIAALATEIVVGALAAVVIGLMVLLNGVIAVIGFFVCILIVFAVIIGFFALIAPFFAGGWVAGRTTTAFGKRAKNRNASVAALLSVIAASVSIFLLWLLAITVGWNAIKTANADFFSDSTLLWILHGTAVVGGLIAAFFAFGTALNDVEAAKFCEACEEYMIETELGTLSTGGLKAMTQALLQDKPPVAASLLCGKEGSDGKVSLFHCPTCTVGYVELLLTFKATYQEESKSNDHEESWRVASAALSRHDVEWFRIFKEHAHDGGSSA